MDLMNIKILLSLAEDDTQDEILAILGTNAMNTICVYLGLTDLPKELYFIAETMVIARYRRIGSEGIQSEKIDVLSTTYTYNIDELAPYKTILDKYKDNRMNDKRMKLL